MVMMGKRQINWLQQEGGAKWTGQTPADVVFTI